MPWWYFEKDELKNTPSSRDGVDPETEKRYRREATNFIKECGNLMNLGYATMHTAIVYLHRFYMFHSFKTFPRFVTACSCLFLAGKVEETPKKCRDIIRKASTILSSQKLASFGDDPKEEVTTMERILLKTIKFDLQVDHPYRFLIEYAKCLKGTGSGDTTIEQVLQKAWNFVNDSLETTLCLQWEPEIIAVAMMYLACKISKYDVVDWKGRTVEHQKWWDMFVKDMSKKILDDICHQVLDLYQNPKNKTEVPESPPQLPPSKASPPMKRAKFSHPTTVAAGLQKMAMCAIPVKVSSSISKDHELPPQVPPTSNNIPYGYPSTSYGQPPYILAPAPPLPVHQVHHKPPLPPNLPYMAQMPMQSSSQSGPRFAPPTGNYYSGPQQHPGHYAASHHPKSRSNHYHQTHQ